MMKRYDVVLVGAGPAAIFAALELAKKDGLNVLILEKGKSLEKRHCPAREGKCIFCRPCAITSGWGGAGAFSDGKLTLSPEVGGWLGDFISLKKLTQLIDYVDSVFQDFGAPAGREYGKDGKIIEDLVKEAKLAELTLVPVRMKHLGTDNCARVLEEIYQFLEGKVDVLFSTKAEEILTQDGEVKGVRTKKGDFLAPIVVLAPGREGADWLSQVGSQLGLELTRNAVDIGLRVEVPAAVMEKVTSILYEAKYIYFSQSFEDKVRTFCMNPYGVVSTELYEDVLTVNGHSYAEKQTENTNFALLVSTSFTEPFKEPIAYGKYIARLANLLGDGIILQRLGDLLKGRRSTWQRVKRSLVSPTLPSATPGDLSFVLPYRYLASILEMLEAMDKVTPGVYSSHTLLYGVEVKFYSSRLKLNLDLETEVKGLHAIGDGAGITRGLVQAAVSGVLVARAIAKKLALSSLKSEG